ncbi:MAG: hypothetical protein Q9P14_06125, partial [candidate division KSB1 bacterium]|nr:hypothetical protein [candidate division KSB1 bacterium]
GQQHGFGSIDDCINLHEPTSLMNDLSLKSRRAFGLYFCLDPDILPPQKFLQLMDHIRIGPKPLY